MDGHERGRRIYVLNMLVQTLSLVPDRRIVAPRQRTRRCPRENRTTDSPCRVKLRAVREGRMDHALEQRWRVMNNLRRRASIDRAHPSQSQGNCLPPANPNRESGHGTSMISRTEARICRVKKLCRLDARESSAPHESRWRGGFAIQFRPNTSHEGCRAPIIRPKTSIDDGQLGHASDQ